MANISGAVLLTRTLERAGVRTIFNLSGNQILPVYDALLDTRIRSIDTRHEAAAVHLADAWARLTGEVGVAMVCGGPGHTNALTGLAVAQAQESPVQLLAGCRQGGRSLVLLAEAYGVPRGPRSPGQARRRRSRLRGRTRANSPRRCARQAVASPIRTRACSRCSARAEPRSRRRQRPRR